MSDYLVFNLKSLSNNSELVEGCENNQNNQISSGTCFVTSPLNDTSCEYIYLVTAAHCVVDREGKPKKVGLIPKRMEGIISNQKIRTRSDDLIDCQILCCKYDGDNDVDFAIVKCSRQEFLQKNGFTTEIPCQYFIPKVGEFRETRLNNMIVGYPSKYKTYRDDRVKGVTFDVLNALMMTFQKRAVFSFGKYLRSEEGSDINIFTNTINKGFSGGPSCELSDLPNDETCPNFHGIVTLFDKDGYGSFSVSNDDFRQAYFKYIDLPSKMDPKIQEMIEEYRNK